ncbi:MAG: hypothetical protein QOG20_4577 [Pseudonocardiales bacterium]|jgi:hypothetical protein|nr:hypothetical protein [Pseudonocardiales bacterium]
MLAAHRIVLHRMPGVREFHELYLSRIDASCRLLEAGDREAEYLRDAENQLLVAYDAL